MSIDEELRRFLELQGSIEKACGLAKEDECEQALADAPHCERPHNHYPPDLHQYGTIDWTT